MGIGIFGEEFEGAEELGAGAGLDDELPSIATIVAFVEGGSGRGDF